ncbi:MAG: GNAT family N-acetyltransferase, partial [Planctomycetota bacterium]
MRHFAHTSVVASVGPDLIGAVTAYRVPDDPTTLFVWQVAVSDAARGQGLAGRMLQFLVQTIPGVDA